GGYPTGLVATAIAVLLAAPMLWLFAFGAALLGRPARRDDEFAPPEAYEEDTAEIDDTSESMLALGAVTHWFLSARAFLRRRLAAMRTADEFGLEAPQASGWRRAAERVEFAEQQEARVSNGGRARIEPEFFAAMVSGGRGQAPAVD